MTTIGFTGLSRMAITDISNEGAAGYYRKTYIIDFLFMKYFYEIEK